MDNRFSNAVRSKFWSKPLIILILLLILLIPLAFIDGLISDRDYVKSTAEESIMRPVGGPLRIEGVLISIPYKKLTQIYNENGVAMTTQTIQQLIFAPNSYELDTQLNPQYLKRGIFQVPIFNGEVAIRAKFNAPNFEYFGVKESEILLNDAVLILGIGNKKSFTAFPVLKADAQDLVQSLIEPEYSPFSQSVYYKLPLNLARDGFELTGLLLMQGGELVNFAPIGQDNKFSLKSSWNSPSFSGGWLPKTRTISNDGFEAQWEISALSANLPQAWSSHSQRIISDDDVKASFIEPVNNYSLITRCVNYAILFLAVPFLAIFLCEIYSNSRIHPIQYLLIGVLDVLFYLLLLCISEHLSFFVSYFIAATAVCATILFYGVAIFKAFKWGLFIALIQAFGYFLLYGILQSEDYAFLMGSVMIFAVTALVMYMTRKIDWYDNSKF
ncbi:MAG: cell envelope integrity protein CreD [Campylobacter sp.]